MAKMTEFERGKREGLRMAIRAIRQWHRANGEAIGDGTSREIVQGAAKAVSRLLHGEDPRRDPTWAGWPEPSHHGRPSSSTKKDSALSPHTEK